MRTLSNGGVEGLGLGSRVGAGHIASGAPCRGKRHNIGIMEVQMEITVCYFWLGFHHLGIRF